MFFQLIFQFTLCLFSFYVPLYPYLLMGVYLLYIFRVFFSTIGYYKIMNIIPRVLENGTQTEMYLQSLNLKAIYLLLPGKGVGFPFYSI